MDSYAMGVAFGKLIGGLVGAAFGALIGALLVQLATRIVAGFRPPYWQAWRASYFGYAASMVIGFIVGMVFFSSTGVTAAGNIMLIFVGFVVQAMIYGGVLKDEEEMAIGFGKACAVSVMQFLIVAVPVGILVGVFFFAIKPAIQKTADEYTAEQQQLPPPQQQRQPQQQQQVAPPPAANANLNTNTNTSTAQPPAPTPHPAVASRELAVRMYPGLSVANSPLNQRFLALYSEAKTSNPALLTQPDWPMTLAEQAVRSLGVAPAPRAGR